MIIKEVGLSHNTVKDKYPSTISNLSIMIHPTTKGMRVSRKKKNNRKIYFSHRDRIIRNDKNKSMIRKNQHKNIFKGSIKLKILN